MTLACLTMTCLVGEVAMVEHLCELQIRAPARGSLVLQFICERGTSAAPPIREEHVCIVQLDHGTTAIGSPRWSGIGDTAGHVGGIARHVSVCRAPRRAAWPAAPDHEISSHGGDSSGIPSIITPCPEWMEIRRALDAGSGARSAAHRLVSLTSAPPSSAWAQNINSTRGEVDMITPRVEERISAHAVGRTLSMPWYSMYGAFKK